MSTILEQKKCVANFSPHHSSQLLTTTEMEPRFSLPSSTPRSSKTELVIGGVQIYIYGLHELEQKSDVAIAVLYLAHQRTRTYLVTEAIAHEILHRYRSDGRKKRVELIAVTMNMRNHGDREVSISFWLFILFSLPFRDLIFALFRFAQKPILPGRTAMRIMGKSFSPTMRR